MNRGCPQWMADCTDETLAEAWCSLNSFGWHPCIPGEPEPVPERYTMGCMPHRGIIMRAIMDRIGQKECLRAWNTRGQHPHMTNEQFEAWWTERPHQKSVMNL